MLAFTPCIQGLAYRVGLAPCWPTKGGWGKYRKWGHVWDTYPLHGHGGCNAAPYPLHGHGGCNAAPYPCTSDRLGKAFRAAPDNSRPNNTSLCHQS